MARVIIMITSLLHKILELHLRIFKCCDVIWIVMVLSFMFLCRRMRLICSCIYTLCLFLHSLIQSEQVPFLYHQHHLEC